MREIKFRAWDGEGMSIPFTLDDIVFEKMTYEKGWATKVYPKLQEGSYNIMQYTGLKDKNGKEVYEGDIVQYYSKGYEVYWINGKFMGCNDIYPENNDYEIIGNIYENPELLTTN